MGNGHEDRAGECQDEITIYTSGYTPELLYLCTGKTVTFQLTDAQSAVVRFDNGDPITLTSDTVASWSTGPLYGSSSGNDYPWSVDGGERAQTPKHGTIRVVPSGSR